jgi:hypothetical protein
MQIEVLSSGCSKCRATIGMIERAAEQAGTVVEIVKVEQPAAILAYGVHATPAVVIDGQVVHSGNLPAHDKVLSWFAPDGIGFLSHPTRHLFFTGKGGVGKTSLSTAAALSLADAGKKVLLVSTDAASNLGEMLGIELRNTPTHVPGAPGLSVLNIDPDNAAESYRQRGDRTDGRQRQRRRSFDGARTALGRLHHGDRILRRVLIAAVRWWRRLRPHPLRQRPDGPHAAPAQLAQGLDRLPERQRPRRLVPGATLRAEDAGAALQGRAGCPE